MNKGLHFLTTVQKKITFDQRTQKILLIIREKLIERVSSIKLFRVILNKHLISKDHMEMLLSKLKSFLYYVTRVKPFLDKK